jgi:hypothetical protein
MSKTKLEILEETANFYNRNNRATHEKFGCAYRNDEGNKCAVGRCMTDEAIEKYGDFDGAASTLANAIGRNELGVNISYGNDAKILDYVLDEEYHGHELEFWGDLQTLHDNQSRWDNEGLSPYGKQLYKSLVEKWKNA